MDILLLRLDAPLMSFGGVVVDHKNPTRRFPTLSLLTGMVGNALGWRHGDAEALTDLQGRLSYAARWDLAPDLLVDYHTTDLGQPHLADPGWTTRGVTEHRKGGTAAKKGTHQRYRHYWANGVMTLAVSVDPGIPSIEEVARALEKPARPLFLGRKTCLPASRVFLGVRKAESVLEALRAEPRDDRAPANGPLEACWPPSEPLEGVAERVSDIKDWSARIHSGSRSITVGMLEGVPACT